MSLDTLRTSLLGASAARIFASEVGPRIMLSLDDGGGAGGDAGAGSGGDGGSAAPAQADPGAGAVPAGKVDAPAAPAEKSEAEQEAELDKTLQAVWDKHNPTRKDSGQFAGKEGEQPPADADQAGKESPDDPAKTATEPAKTPAIEAPNSWSGEMKAKWAALPPDVQTYVTQREGESHKAITRLGEQLKSYEPIGQTLQHHEATFKRHGASYADGISRMMDVQNMLDANPAQGLLAIGDLYGIDLRSFFGAQAAGGDTRQAGFDPALVQLTTRLREVEGQLTARDRAEEDERQSTALSAVAEFRKDKPYFDEVKSVMGALMTGGQAATLDQAYDMAVHANPAVRQRILTDQRKADDEKRTADGKARAEAARKAGGVNVTGSFASSSPKSADDELAEIARRHYGS